MHTVETFRLSAAPARVLVVEDEEPLREALCGLLQDKGITVVGQAGDGAAAVELARQTRPDVVLMDYRMPGQDGLEAFGLMTVEFPLMQAVLFTAYDEEALALEAERAHVYCLLVKGCPPSLVVEMVVRAAAYKRELEQGARNRASQAPPAPSGGE